MPNGEKEGLSSLTIENVYGQPVKVELERLASGKYKWVISYHAEANQEIVDLVTDIDRKLREQFIEERPETTNP